MAKKPTPTYTIKPLPPKKRGKSDAELIREARAGTITWAKASAGLIANGHPAADAADIITTAQKPSAKTPAYAGPTATDILKQAALTKDWATARAALLKIPNYSPAKADAEIQIARAALAKSAKVASPVTQSVITSNLGPGSSTADQAAAIAKLTQRGISKGDAEILVHQKVTPSPNVPTLDAILNGLKYGTIGRDQASIYFSQLGVSPKLAQQYLATAKATYDKWVVLGSDGRLKFTPITSETHPPANVLKYGPTPLTQSSFISTWTQNYKDQFFAYTGRQATGREVQQILAKGITPYALANGLAQNQPVSEILGSKTKTPTVSFQNSPTYKQHAGSVIAYAKSILGQNWKPDQKLVGQALAQSWDQAKLDGVLRQRPEYLHGPEFQDGAAKKAAVYQQIFGVPDENAMHTIGQAQLAGWTDDEFARYLRAQPQYTKSPEYLSKILSFGQALGLITGQQPGLVTGGSQAGQPMPNPNPSTGQNVPNNPRLPAPSPVQSPINYVPTNLGA